MPLLALGIRARQTYSDAKRCYERRTEPSPAPSSLPPLSFYLILSPCSHSPLTNHRPWNPSWRPAATSSRALRKTTWTLWQPWDQRQGELCLISFSDNIVLGTRSLPRRKRGLRRQAQILNLQRWHISASHQDD